MAALRAVALDRLGRTRQALAAADALLAEAPPDDHALNTLALVLKPAGRLADLGPAFERAAAKDPADESLAKGVFLSAVRAGDAAGMQRAALRLDKAFGAGLALKREPPQRYKWYAALAVVLQAREAALAEADERVVAAAARVASAGAAATQPQQQQQQQRKSALLLQLAEGMVRRLNATSVKAEEVLRASGSGGGGAAAPTPSSSSSSPSPPNNNPLALTREAAMLHLGLLQALRRYDEALELLQGDEEGDEEEKKDNEGAAPAPPPCSSPSSPLPAGAYARAIPLEEERLLARAALLQARGDRAGAASLYECHLREHAPDDWASGRHYLDCVLPMAGGGGGETGCWSSRLVPAQVPHVSSAAVAREVLGLGGGCGHADGAAAASSPASAAGAAPEEAAEALAAATAAAVQGAAERLIADLARVQAEQQAAFDAAKAEAKKAKAAATEGGGAAKDAAAPKPGGGLLEGEDAAAAQRRRRAQMRLARLPASPRFAPLLRCELALRRWAAAASASAPEAGGPRGLAEAVAAFHASLGHLDSCFPDARPYLEALAFGAGAQGSEGGSAASASAAACAWLAGELDERASSGAEGDDDDDAEETLEPLRRCVSAMQMSAHLLGPGPASAPAAARLHARRALPLALSLRLDPRERGPADELPAMVADALLRGGGRENKAGGGSSLMPLFLLLKAILHLEAACRARPHVASTRIALCAAHGLAGSPRRALAHFAALDAKHVQHDTLSSHLALPLQVLAFWWGSGGGGGGGGGGSKAVGRGLLAASAASTSSPPLALTALRGVVDLCDHHARDAGDTLNTALRNGTHTKVAEFAAFRERLAASQACLAARAEGALLLVLAVRASASSSSSAAAKSNNNKAPSFAALAGARRALKAVVGGGGGGGGDDDGEEEEEQEAVAAAAAIGLPPPRALRAPTPDALDAWALRARFNADLSVRPGWLAPDGGPLAFGVLRWWEAVVAMEDEEGEELEQRRRLPPWWLRSGAAEAQGVPEAAALRASLRASTEQRALLQHLLVAALGLESPLPVAAAAAGGGGKRQAAAAAAKTAGAVTAAAASSSSSSPPSRRPTLSELLPRMCSAVARSMAPHAPAVAAATAGAGVDAAVAAVAEAAAAVTAGVGSPLPSSALLQAADLALFAAVEPLLAKEEGQGGGQAAAAEARARALVAVLSALEGRVGAAAASAAAEQAAAAGGHGLVPGSALSLASLIAWDLGERAALCLEACAEAALLAGAGAAGSASGVCAALAALLAKVEAASAASAGLEPAAVADALVGELMRDPDAPDLFGAEGGDGAGAAAIAREALLAVAEGQREAGASAAARARALAARVRAAQEVLETRR